VIPKMRQKGAVPIPYIIALLLGIAVVAIIGYWFFILGGEWGGETTLQGCRRKATTYCVAWQTAGYGVDDGIPDLGTSSGWFGGEDQYPECKAHRETIGFTGTNAVEDEAVCRGIMGIPTTTTP
jgi:hypothetical protein